MEQKSDITNLTSIQSLESQSLNSGPCGETIIAEATWRFWPSSQSWERSPRKILRRATIGFSLDMQTPTIS